jgi:cyanophycinase
MSPRQLFLLGGSAAYGVVVDEFVPAAGGANAVIALLMQGGSNWQKYVPQYVQPLEQCGVTRYHPIVPDENGALVLDEVAAALREATVILIGGGHTPTYQRLYAAEPVRGWIRDRYQEGIPVVGVSAGALISPEPCVLGRDETADGVPKLARGLGLVGDLAIEVHFSERERLPYLLEAMSHLRAKVGWGIDEPACLVLRGGQVERVLGRSVHRVEITSFVEKTYEITEYFGSGSAMRRSGSG